MTETDVAQHMEKTPFQRRATTTASALIVIGDHFNASEKGR